MDNDNLQSPSQAPADNAIIHNQIPIPEPLQTTTTPIQPQRPRPALGSLSLFYALLSLTSMFFTFFLSAILTDSHFYDNFPIAKLVVWLIPISNLASTILGIITAAFFFTGRKIPTKLYISLEIFFFLPLLVFLVTAIAESQI